MLFFQERTIAGRCLNKLADNPQKIGKPNCNDKYKACERSADGKVVLGSDAFFLLNQA
jgi:hypothetical protein